MGLSQRMVALLVPAVIISVVTGAAVMMMSVRGQLIEVEVERIELETALRKSALDARMGELQRDAAFFAATAPVRGLMRALANDGVDPTDDSSAELWTARITSNFTEALRHNPEYVQARVILLTDDGAPEWVRVERKPDGTVFAQPREALQDKALEPYVIEGRQAAPGDVVLSNITLNREHGEIEVPHRPMLRATSTFADDDGNTFGMVVLNVSVGRVLNEVVYAHDGPESFSVVDTDGHVLAHPVAGVAFGHELGSASTVHDASLADSLAHASTTAEVTSWIDRDDSMVRSVRRVSLGGANDRAILLVGEQSFETISGVIVSALPNAVLAGGVLALLAAALATFLGRRAIAPVVKLTKAVENFDPDAENFELPDGLSGEAKELAAVIHQALDALKQRNKAIAASNVELEQFAYVASHDLQEPLRTIMTFSRLLHSEYNDRLDSEGKQMMGFVITSCTRMSALIADLLDYSRLRYEPEPEDVDLKDIVDRVVEDQSTALDECSGSIHVGPMPTMRLYPQGVQVLFQNLVSNAIKYRRPDAPPVIHITSTQTPDGHEFRVIDNGIGIAPEYHDKVFRIFQRLHRRDEFEGTGIGLALCARVASLHNGSIWIEDADVGTTVVVLLKDVP